MDTSPGILVYSVVAYCCSCSLLLLSAAVDAAVVDAVAPARTTVPTPNSESKHYFSKCMYMYTSIKFLAGDTSEGGRIRYIEVANNEQHLYLYVLRTGRLDRSKKTGRGSWRPPPLPPRQKSGPQARTRGREELWKLGRTARLMLARLTPW